MKRHRGCRISGSFGASEIPLPLSFFYLYGEVEAGRETHFLALRFPCEIDLGHRHCQVGSLAGAAHLLNDNAGVLR